MSFEGGESSLGVRSFDVREALSECFVAHVIAMSSDDDLDLDALVGRRAALALVSPRGARRVLRGVCLSAEQVRVEDRGLSTYEIEIGPKLALLGHRSHYRVFQHRTIPEIVESILSQWGIVARLVLDRDRYPRLEYRVQFAESDLAFVCRLLEEAGIAFTFPTEDEDDAPDILLEDASHRSEAEIAAQHVEHAVLEHDGPVVTRVRVGRKLRTGRVIVKDQHFRLRADANLSGEVAVKGAEAFEAFRYRHGSSVTESGHVGDTPVADARGAARPDPKRLEALARQDLERERSRRREVSFETNIGELRPGRTITVAGHPREELSDGKLVVTELHTTGDVNARAWRAEARALFTDIPFRPLLATPKPRANGIQTATVVGPAGEPIHTDELGRVLVQFPWDREHSFDENSSCWLRVSQGWAGGGHASFALPRVGDEVLVSFFDADPDQPIVIGRVHNAQSPVPYRLPANKTVSTWRSASIPETGGFNELKFDDAAGGELVAIQAERDMRTLVKNTDAIDVGTSRAAQIGTTDDVLAGERHTIRVAGASGDATTRIETTDGKIVLTSGQARIVIDGPDIVFEAPGSFVVKAAGLVRVESSEGDVVVQGGPIVRINPRGAGEHPDAPGGAIPFDLPDGEGADVFDDFMGEVANRSWFDPESPTYLDEATSPGGSLDPTPRGGRDDELRAFKYAVAARVLGLPEGVVLRRAGTLNRKHNGRAAGAGDPGNGVFGGEAPYGNDEAQLAAMKKGFAYFDAQYSETA